MDIKQLTYFKTVVEEGSISAASKKLFMSQPPLSSQISKLEDELGCQLFYRGARHIELTDAGKTLYQYCVSIIDLKNQAIDETKDVGLNSQKTIKIGIVSSLVSSHALTWIENFYKTKPGIAFDITEGDTFSLLNKLSSNEIPLALLRTPFNNNGLTCHTLFSDKLVAIGKKEILEANPTLKLKDLMTMPLVTYHRWKAHIQKEFEKQDLRAKFSCVNADARTTIYFVESDLGIGIVPESALSMIKDKDVVSKKVDDLSIESQVILARSSNELMNPLTSEFESYLINLAKDL